MEKVIRVVRRFFWWCAAVDVEVITNPQCPGIDRIKYAVVGAVIFSTTVVATLGWTHNANLIFGSGPLQLSLAIGLGALIGVLVFCMERMLVVSIPPNVTRHGRIMAFLWRGILAAFTAAMMTTPIALSYFKNEIVAKLDEEKLQLMTDKRGTIDRLFGLSSTTSAIGHLDVALAANRQQRDQLPTDVQEIRSKTDACTAEDEKLRRSLQPRIAVASAQQAALNRQRTELPWEEGALRGRAAALTKQINVWTRTLLDKSQACAELVQRFQAAKERYYVGLEDDRNRLLADRTQQEAALKGARLAAKPILATSDDVVAQKTTPDLGAQIRALQKIATDSSFARAMLAVFFTFFYMVDTLPIIAKLTSRSIYDRFLGAREQKLIAQIEADITTTRVRATIRAESALAEQAAFRSYTTENGARAFIEQAAVHARFEAAKAEARAPFQYVMAVISEYEQVRNDIDALEIRIQSGADAESDVARFRGSLHEAARKATSSLNRACEIAANSNARIVPEVPCQTSVG